jgi:hypothetical protein
MRDCSALIRNWQSRWREIGSSSTLAQPVTIAPPLTQPAKQPKVRRR